jgi:putative Holliday junction resolvase
MTHSLEGRILALDVGDRRIGVALSDPLGFTAQPHSVIERTQLGEDVEAVRTLVESTGAVRIVAGMPLNAKGEKGHQAEQVQLFLDALKDAVSVDVATMDERYTTASAERSLIAGNMRRKKRKQVVDKIAAQQILQTYLDREASRKKRGE